MNGFPGNEYPPEILEAAEKTLDSVLSNCSESCGGTDALRTAAIVDIAKGLMAERHRWFEAIDDHKDEIERLRLRIRNDEKTASKILQMQKDQQLKVAELHEAITVLLSRVKGSAA